MILTRSRGRFCRKEMEGKNVEDRVILIHNEYRHNVKFRQYVDKYAKNHDITVVEAFSHNLVRQAALYYTDV